MAIKDALLPEFDQEMRVTRTHLERIQDEKLSWQPHEKSMSLQSLASHLAEIPDWGVSTLAADSFDVNPPGGSAYVPAKYGSREETLTAFDKNVKTARMKLSEMTDEEFMKPWSLLAGGQTLFTMPKVAVLRSFMFSHLVHHRGQFSVYLRMTGAAVPSTYGPSADEAGM